VRVAIVNSYYPAYLRHIYGADPGLASLAYQEQHEALMSQLFAQADAYSRGLREHGVEAIDLVMNCEPLQLQWLKEHRAGLRWRRAASSVLRRIPGGAREGIHRRLLHRRIVRAQVEWFEADVVLIHPLTLWSPPELKGLRRPGRLIVGQIASGPPPDELLREFDLLLSSFPHFVERFRALGIDSEYLAHFFNSRAGETLETAGSLGDDRRIDVSFIGGVNPAGHRAGTAILEEVCRRLPVEIWGYGGEALPVGSTVRSRFRGELWGIDMYRVLAQSKIALNRHVDAASGYANNMRLFEATGMGALLITEEAPNLDQLFKPDVEVATYRDADELIAKIRYYLADDVERRQVAAAGQRRTLRNHTERQRMGELSSILTRRLPS
jgi:spore maturation protein CgeB